MTTRLMPTGRGLASDYDRLRHQVRDFLDEQVAAGLYVPQLDSWNGGWNPTFSQALAERGWVGMTVPREHGGPGRTFVERFVVTEELLAAGAPVSAHWVADRQAAPALLRYGTPEQQREFLPRIVSAELFWAIGMSEPEAGSDLASVRTRAEPTAGGWRLTGTKLWTSGADLADLFFVLARSSPLDPQRRHDGLSQFVVPLDAPGISVSPIADMTGGTHFAEVHLDGVFVPSERVLGEIGRGWDQVTSELSYERSGPERFLSTFVLLAEYLTGTDASDIPDDPRIGATLARLYALHCMSFTVAETLARSEAADVAAAVVKLLGTRFEGDVVDLIDELTADHQARSRPVQLLHDGVMARPGFTLRGGTNEILRGVVARGLGLR